jgi:hypothetical protein
MQDESRKHRPQIAIVNPLWLGSAGAPHHAQEVSESSSSAAMMAVVVPEAGVWQIVSAPDAIMMFKIQGPDSSALTASYACFTSPAQPGYLATAH